MNKATVKFSKMSRKIAWPVECGDVSVLYRLIRDACEIPLEMNIKCYREHNREPLELEYVLNGSIKEFSVDIDEEDFFEIYPHAAVLLEYLSPPTPSKNAKGDDKLGYYQYIPDRDSEVEDLHDSSSISDTEASCSESLQLLSNSREVRIEVDPSFRGSAFQNQIIKFTRILAHLVNERTYLAWIRMDLAFITLSFKYMKLASNYRVNEKNVVSTIVFICGGVFMIALPVTWYTGWKRFQVCRDMLDFDTSKLDAYLHVMGFDYNTISLAVIIITSFIGIITASSIIIWTSVD